MKEVRHPGIILKEDYLLKKKQRALRIAEHTSLDPSTLSELIMGKRRLTLRVAIELGKFYNENPRVWLKRQMEYDLYEAGFEG